MGEERSSATEFEALFGFAPRPMSAGGFGDVTGREFVRRALGNLANESKRCATALAVFVEDIRAIDITVLSEVELLELQGNETRLRASLTEARDASMNARRIAGCFKYLPSPLSLDRGRDNN